MLRVGLTGGLGSGKSTVAAMLRAHGAHVLNSDDIGRALMQPGQPVYHRILAAFGPTVLYQSAVNPDPGIPAPLDRAALARIAFDSNASRLEELNRIVHPAVIARQVSLINAIAATDSTAIVVVESALLFETRHAGPDGWRSRFDRVILVTAPVDLRIQRFVSRALHQHQLRHEPVTPAIRNELRAEARLRLQYQLPDSEKIPASDFVLHNRGSLPDLQAAVDLLWTTLRAT